jgi:hypothetical protein
VFDDDNDGALDDVDSDDNNENVCSDVDGDSCDDCSDGSYGLDDDGDDNDGDGWCNTGDPYPDCAYDNANDPSVYPDSIDVNPLDDCGNCHGDGFSATCIGSDDCNDMACDGDCDQVAYIDDCGECDDDFNTDCIDLVIDLHSGINLISFYALAEDVSVGTIFGDAYGVLTEGAAAVNNDGTWIGSLEQVSQDAGYWVIVTADDALEILDADPINYDADGEVIYSMHYGPNLISYPLQTSQSVSDALGDVAGNVYATPSAATAYTFPATSPNASDTD